MKGIGEYFVFHQGFYIFIMQYQKPISLSNYNTALMNHGYPKQFCNINNEMKKGPSVSYLNGKLFSTSAVLFIFNF